MIHSFISKSNLIYINDLYLREIIMNFKLNSENSHSNYNSFGSLFSYNYILLVVITWEHLGISLRINRAS